MANRANPFDWSGGDPALDFVNTLDERPSGAPVENLATYGDLVRFAALAGLIEPSTSDRLRSLEGPKASLDAIASEVRRAHAARVLVATATSNAVRHSWLSPFSPEIPLHACALAVETLLVTADHNRIRKCGASDCGVYFIDTSKAHRRQWCSMQNCGNREKQRRWRSGAD
jgi:hypothetical protein